MEKPAEIRVGDIFERGNTRYLVETKKYSSTTVEAIRFNNGESDGLVDVALCELYTYKFIGNIFAL